jgi:hypothetical protein
VNATTTGYNVDTKWYTDISATYHITSELDKLMMKEKYGGLDQMHMASSSGMPTSHLGHSTIHTQDRDIILSHSSCS